MRTIASAVALVLMMGAAPIAEAATYRPADAAALATAVGKVNPGDTVYLTAGRVYTLPGGGANCGLILGRSGTSSARVTLTVEGTGRAILDASRVRDSSGYSNYGLCLRGSWWTVSKIDVRGAYQARADGEAFGYYVTGPNNTMQNVRAYRNQGVGIFWSGPGGLLRNCLSYENYDPLSGGGNGDGIAVSYLPQGSPGVTVEGCTSRDNSDDGFDLWESEAPVTLRNSTARKNGFRPLTSTPAGDGRGFKLGRNDSGPRHVLDGSSGYSNRVLCVDWNAGAGPVELRNVTCEGNGEVAGSQIELGPYDNVIVP
jgi:hypothetical protein